MEGRNPEAQKFPCAVNATMLLEEWRLTSVRVRYTRIAQLWAYTSSAVHSVSSCVFSPFSERVWGELDAFVC